MTSAISQSSVATVVEDLVSDRSIPLKVCMIFLNCGQLISCWIAVGYFIKNYEIWSQLELTLSLVLLLTGSYLIPCIANAVIYGRRWKRSSVSNRRQIEEENKQAWVCLRIALSLSGLPTVGRYIETIIVSRKLSVLEKKHVKESVVSHREGSQLHPIGTSRIGSTVNQLKSGNMQRNNSVISGMSHASSTSGIPETSQRKVRKARRQYKRCEHDGSLMALIAGSAGAGPMAIGLGFLYFQREEIHAMATDQMTVVFISFVLNLLWLAATLTHFYPARHVLSEAEFERGIRPSQTWALALLYISHVIQVTLRVICFVIFVNWFYAYVCIPMIFHWLLGAFLLIGYRSYMKSKTVGRPLGERVRKHTASVISALFFGYVGIFDFVNANEGKTRARYLIYYSFYYIENVAMLVIWIMRNPTTQIRYPVPFVCSVLGLFWLGFILFQIYLYYFSYSPYGASIVGLWSRHHNPKANNYAQEVREPVFGIPVAQSAVPFWRQSQHHGDHHHNTGSNMSSSVVTGSKQSSSQMRQLSRPVTLATIKSMSPSIMSSQSQDNRTPSIFSQPGSSQINGPSQDRSRINPPPVIAQKIRMENSSRPKSRPTTSSSSGSSSPSTTDDDDDDCQVFTPKPRTQSQPDLSYQLSNNSYASLSATTPTQSSLMIVPGSAGDLSGQFKAAPVHYGESVRGGRTVGAPSRSLDNVRRGTLPVTQAPHSTTRRIGPPPTTTTMMTAPLRPLPSTDQIKRMDPRSMGPRQRSILGRRQ